MIPRGSDHYTTEKILRLFSESYDFPVKGYKQPRFLGDKNITNLRILETDLIYIVGIPHENCDFDVLKSWNHLGHYGKIIELHHKIYLQAASLISLFISEKFVNFIKVANF